MSEGRPAGSPARLTGRLLAIGDATLTILPKPRSEAFVVPRDSISTLEVSRRGSRRGKNAAIGAGIALGVGIVWARAEVAQCEASGQWFCGLAYTAVPILFMPAGTLIGVATGGERWQSLEPGQLRVSVAPVRSGVAASLSIGFPGRGRR
jgi:hypothetical protein